MNSNQKKITSFISSQPHAPFLQTPEWGFFQEQLGFQSVTSTQEDTKGFVQASARMVEYPLFFSKKYWYCPQGYIGNETSSLKLLLPRLIDEAKKLAIPFIRYDRPYWKDTDEIGEFAKKNALQIRQTVDAQPRCTLLLDCSKSEKELLAEMHQKTRYNIHIAEKKNITTHRADSMKEAKAKLVVFCELLTKTGKRHAIRMYSKKYFETLFECMENTPLKLHLYTTEKDGTLLAGSLLLLFGDTATYLHGASDYTFRSSMAPYLLQWSMIQDAKRLGMRWYDFWGVAPADKKNHPLAGVSIFKKGFGGQVVCGRGTFDLVCDPWFYQVYKMGRLLRRTVGRSF